jgi:hypothetical protein
MQVNNLKEWQTARFDEAAIKILLDFILLSDFGRTKAIHQALFKVLSAYIESRPNVTMVTKDKDTDEVNMDDTYYWITYLYDTLYKIFENVSLLNGLREYKLGTGNILSNYYESRIDELSSSISEYQSAIK